MVWAGVSAVGRTSLVFVPPGVKINALTYQDLILKLFVNISGEQCLITSHSCFNKMVPPPTLQKVVKSGFELNFRVITQAGMASFKPRSESFGFLSLVHIRVKGLFELAQESGRFKEDSMQRMGPYSPGNHAYRCWSRSETVRGSNKEKGRIYWMSCVKLNPDSAYSIMLQYLVNRNSFRRFIVVFQWDRTYSPPCIRTIDEET